MIEFSAWHPTPLHPEETVMDSTLCRSGLLMPGSSFSPDCGHHDFGPTAEIRHPVHEPSIGVVVFVTHKGEHAEALLDIEGMWRCPKLPVLDRVLNALHAPRRDSEDDVPFGLAELMRVAAWLKGVARVHRP
jgi:hypothetical protein